MLLAVYETSMGESNGLVWDSPPFGLECPVVSDLGLNDRTIGHHTSPLRAFKPRQFPNRGATGKGASFISLRKSLYSPRRLADYGEKANDNLMVMCRVETARAEVEALNSLRG